jgi:hypothetical protein
MLKLQAYHFNMLHELKAPDMQKREYNIVSGLLTLPKTGKA